MVGIGVVWLIYCLFRSVHTALFHKRERIQVGHKVLQPLYVGSGGWRTVVSSVPAIYLRKFMVCDEDEPITARLASRHC
jgi:hypothetical protein